MWIISLNASKLSLSINEDVEVCNVVNRNEIKCLSESYLILYNKKIFIEFLYGLEYVLMLFTELRRCFKNILDKTVIHNFSGRTWVPIQYKCFLSVIATDQIDEEQKNYRMPALWTCLAEKVRWNWCLIAVHQFTDARAATQTSYNGNLFGISRHSNYQNLSEQWVCVELQEITKKNKFKL